MVALTNLKSLENKANTAISLAVVQNAISNYSNTALGTRQKQRKRCKSNTCNAFAFS